MFQRFPGWWVLLSVVTGAAAGVPDLQNRLIQNRAPGVRLQVGV